MSIFTKIWDWIMDFIFGLVEGVMSLLPDSPIQKTEFMQESGTFENVMGYINYFVPVGPMLGILTTYLTAVAVWYVVRWVLRLGRYID